MKIAVVTDFISSRWSGGETVQLCICPPQAQYADRGFLWRLSTASVECESSVFTHLPDYNRIIALLGGQLSLDIGGRLEKLSPCTPFSFDGGAAVTGYGRAVDFNLMLRKGMCEGQMRPLENGRMDFGPRNGWAGTAHLIYAADPVSVRWEGGGAALAAGSLLRLDGADRLTVEAAPKGRAMAASVWYNP